MIHCLDACTHITHVKSGFYISFYKEHANIYAVLFTKIYSQISEQCYL